MIESLPPILCRNCTKQIPVHELSDHTKICGLQQTSQMVEPKLIPFPKSAKDIGFSFISHPQQNPGNEDLGGNPYNFVSPNFQMGDGVNTQ